MSGAALLAVRCGVVVLADCDGRIIYPDSYPDFVASGRTREELMEILTAVNLAYLPSREGGWSTRKEWRDVLSGGEKQRLSVSELLCVSAVKLMTCVVDGYGSGVLPSAAIRHPRWWVCACTTRACPNIS